MSASSRTVILSLFAHFSILSSPSSQSSVRCHTSVRFITCFVGYHKIFLIVFLSKSAKEKALIFPMCGFRYTVGQHEYIHTKSAFPSSIRGINSSFLCVIVL